MTKREDPESRLLELTALPTAAGKEHLMQAYLDRWLARRSRSLKWRRDGVGNLLIRRREPGRTPPLLITAHLDHPAFVVRAVEGREAELEFRGGVHDAYFPGTRIEVFAGDGTRRVARITEVDAKATPFKKVRARLAVDGDGITAGDIGRWLLPGASISRGRLRTNACDDLAAVAAALEAFDAIRRKRGCEHVGLLFTVAEEVGFLGAIEVARATARGRGGLCGLRGPVTAVAPARRPVAGLLASGASPFQILVQCFRFSLEFQNSIFGVYWPISFFEKLVKS